MPRSNNKLTDSLLSGTVPQCLVVERVGIGDEIIKGRFLVASSDLQRTLARGCSKTSESRKSNYGGLVEVLTCSGYPEQVMAYDHTVKRTSTSATFTDFGACSRIGGPPVDNIDGLRCFLMRDRTTNRRHVMMISKEVGDFDPIKNNGMAVVAIDGSATGQRHLLIDGNGNV